MRGSLLRKMVIGRLHEKVRNLIVYFKKIRLKLHINFDIYCLQFQEVTQFITGNVLRLYFVKPTITALFFQVTLFSGNVPTHTPIKL